MALLSYLSCLDLDMYSMDIHEFPNVFSVIQPVFDVKIYMATDNRIRALKRKLKFHTQILLIVVSACMNVRMCECLSAQI